MGILNALGMVFGKLMFFIYNTIGFHSYALSIIFFTIATKLILLPLTVKQMKTTRKMQELQPELTRIQERYKNDKEKLNEETMKFYQEKGYNPTAGCLPLLIQLPIIFALFYVIRMPMSYMLEIPARAIGQMTVVSINNGDMGYGRVGKETFDKISGDPTQVYKEFNQKDPYFEVTLFDLIDKNPDLVNENPYLSDEKKELLSGFSLKMFNFFNFGVPPTYNLKAIAEDPGRNVPALILLILAVLTTYFTSSLLMPATQTNNKNQGCSGKSMLWMSPIMTLWIGFSTPSGLSFYWTINNILSFTQQKSLNVFFKDTKDSGDANKIVGKANTANISEKKEEKSVGKVSNKRSKKRR